MLTLDELADEIRLPSARGRKEVPLSMVVVRELGEDDIPLLDALKGSTTPPLARIRTAHHALARLIAQGVAQEEISAITGYSPSRISILKQDQSFKELISYYSTQVEEKYLDTHERLARLGQSFLDEIQERLEEDPTQFTTPQLFEGAKFTLDRSVAPPKGGSGGSGANSGPISVSINFVKPPGGRVEVVAPREPKMIDITPGEDGDEGAE